MKLKNLLFDETAVKRALTRLSYEIFERANNIENTVLVGIKTRGVPIAEIISENLAKNSGVKVPVLELDITHYRDDVKREIEVQDSLKRSDVEGKDVILVDDVLFTGRTTRAAIDAVFSAGRASSIKLAVLVDRGHRELPIRADFVGKNVPSSMREKIIVKLEPTDDETSVGIYE
ncbi:MAG: bifunctional pyr operon transcriptional regulator/uracil phosphoribosyltransferase PyrR [Clostridia bacterium]|nr:bifunctional pyr operon transcriptional regulator/uracil phosphoribosyltransferase PyrR [Clostridia bacterium]